MPRKKVRSPHEKKALSYAKDRRNAYGENDKASRKLIPLRKAAESRQDRRRVAQEVNLLPKLHEEAADVLESSVRRDVHRVGGWKKAADEPLGKIVARAEQAREASFGRKARSRARQARVQESLKSAGMIFETDDPEALRRKASRSRRTARMLMHHAKSSKHAEIAKQSAERFLRDAQAYEERAEEIIRMRTGGATAGP